MLVWAVRTSANAFIVAAFIASLFKRRPKSRSDTYRKTCLNTLPFLLKLQLDHNSQKWHYEITVVTSLHFDSISQQSLFLLSQHIITDMFYVVVGAHVGYRLKEPTVVAQCLV